MSAAPTIPFFREINDCNEATGFRAKTDLPDFYVCTMEETYPDTRRVMPPYRRGFYQITLLEDSTDATVRLETEAFTGNGRLLFFAAPEHVLSWVRGERQRGFIIYFKAALMAEHPRPLDETFPFFGLYAMNVLPLEGLSPSKHGMLRAQFERIHDVFRAGHPYRLPQLAALTTALLYDCRVLYDLQQTAFARQPASSALVQRFQQLVWRCFTTVRTVDEYAHCLTVSADHLSATVKARTGRTAREIIAERIVLEAKRLLGFTDLSVSEIADHLQFSEPSHFARFFKRHTGRTPLDFRRDANRTTALEELTTAR